MAPPRLAIFYGALFLFIGIATPFWPVWLEAQGLGPADIGLVLAAGTAAQVVASPLLARVADHLGERRRPIIWLSLGALTAFSFFWVSTTLAAILAVTVVFHAFWGPLMPLMESLTMRSRELRPFDYGRVRIAGSLTFVLGAVLMGRAIDMGPETMAPRDLIFIGLWLAVAFTLGAATWLPAPPFPAAEPTRRPVSDLLKRPSFAAVILAATLIQASHAAYYGFASLHWLHEGLSETAIGLLWAEGVAVEVILFLFSGRVVRRMGALNLILLGGLAAVVRWSVFPLTADPAALVLFQALHGLTFGAVHLGIIHYITESAPPALSATAQALFASMLGAAMAAGALLSGHLFEAFGANAFLAMAISAGLGFVILLGMRRRR